MKKLTCLLLLLQLSFVLFAQTNVDSLVNILNTKKLSPNEQLSIYKELCEIYSENEVDKCIFYAQEGLKLAEKMDEKSYTSLFNGEIGVNYYTKSIYDTAAVYLEKSLEWAVKSGDKGQEASANIDLGNAYRRQAQYDKALEKYMRAMHIYENIKNKDKYAIALMNIGGIHEILKNYERAAYYLKQAEEISKTIDSKNLQMSVSYRLAMLYRREGKNKEAIKHALKANEISRAIHNKKYEIASLTLLVSAYTNMGAFDKSREYADQCVELAENYGDKRLLMGVLNEFSDIYFKQGLYKECADLTFKAWSMDSTDLVYATDAAFGLSLANIYLGDKNKAAYFLNNFNNLILQRTDKNSREALLEMEIKYETEKKEIHIAALEKQQRLYFILGITILTALLLGIGLLFYRHRLTNQKQKLAEQQIKQLEQEKELIATRSTLEAEKAEREIIARDLHDGVGAMLSVVKNNMDVMKSHSIIENTEVNHFNNALELLDKSIKELRRVAHHIMPATLIEKGLVVALDDFCRSIPEAAFHSKDADRRFDAEKELIIYRCAYELINNALRHSKASQINVHLSMDERTVFLSVVDDGCGFDPQTATMGMGIKNMHTRLSAFGGKLDIYSTTGNGCEINVELDI